MNIRSIITTYITGSTLSHRYQGSKINMQVFSPNLIQCLGFKLDISLDITWLINKSFHELISSRSSNYSRWYPTST